jgi:glucokinase
LNHIRNEAIARHEAYRKSVLSRIAPNPKILTNIHVVDAFQQSDPFVIECVRETARPLAGVLAAIHAAAGIERFIIIGGFALAMGESYRRLLAELAGSCSWSVSQDWEGMLELGESDDLSGLIGAGRYGCEFLLTR